MHFAGLQEVHFNDEQASGVDKKIQYIANMGDSRPAWSWHRSMVSPNLPRDIVLRLQGEIARVLCSPEVKDQLAGLGAEPVGSTSEQFAAHLQSEMARYAKVVKDAHIKAD